MWFFAYVGCLIIGSSMKLSWSREANVFVILISVNDTELLLLFRLMHHIPYDVKHRE